MIKDYVGWFWTFFQNFFFLYTGIFKSLPLQNHSIGNHPKWDLTTLGVFFLWLWRPLPVNQNIVGTKELCFISNQTLVERTKNIHRFFTKESILSIKTKNSFFVVSFAQMLQPLIARKISAAIYVLILKCSQLPMWTNKEKHFIAFCELI